MIAEPKRWVRDGLDLTQAMTQRVLFLCSSLEPGRDGVGDYTRLLAAACRRAGNPSAVVALQDPFVNEPTQLDDDDGPIELRLPARLATEEKEQRCLEFREQFRPDWLSLQLVPYAFHPKGMVAAAIPFFRHVTGGLPLHLMFHELWVGAGRPSPLRHYAVGFLQARGIRRLLAQLQPRFVTASNLVYAAMLNRVGAAAEVLPLFGNIPLNRKPASLPALFPGTSLTEESRHDWWIGIFFGALHAQWKPEPLFTRLLKASRARGKRLCLVLAGRAGSVGQARWKDLRETYGREIHFVNLGERSTAEISSLLQAADFGLASTPWRLIGKSGAAAAMLDHGLPVIVSRDDFHPFHGSKEPPGADPLLIRGDEHLTARLVQGLQKRAPEHRVDAIAQALCRRISLAAKP